MKKLTKKYSVQLAGLLLLLALLPVSCIKDDYAAKGKATVQVTFTTRALSDETIAGNELADNERMQTLRVIVAKGSKILYNEYYTGDDFAQYENGQKYKTVTFSELVTEDEADKTFVFYAVANEEGIYNWPTQITSLDQLPENITLSTTSDLIPQTAKQSITVNIPQEGGGIQKETMQLEFVVAKVRLTINNTSSGEQNVNSINLSGLNMTSTPLFARETLSGVTDGTLSLGDMTVLARESKTVYAYFFENTKGDYKLTADWNGIQEIALGDYDISEIKRGTLLDITVNLQADVTISTTVEMLDWNNKEMDIPAFK